jgi:hypothetical protein
MKRNKKIAMDVRALAVKVLEHYDMPPDARLKGIEHNPKNNKIIFEFEHQTFDLVKTTPLVKVRATYDSETTSKSKAKKK